MKKVSNFMMMISFIIIIFASCSDNDIIVNAHETESTELMSNPNYVTYEQALQNAIRFLSEGDSSRTTRAIRFNVQDHYEYVSPRQTRSLDGKESTATRFHVINFADNGGFALVAADKRATPIYAYSDKGYLDIEDAIAHTGFDEFMQQAEENFQKEIGENRGGGYDQFDTIYYQQLDPYHISQLPTVMHNGQLCYYYCTYCPQANYSYLLTTEWGQSYPYNAFCKRIPDPNNPGTDYICVAGCLPIAVSQVVGYHQYPTTVIDSTNTPHPLPWSLILSQPSYEPLDFYQLSDRVEPLAHLISIVGHNAHVNYGITETGGDIDGAIDAFEDFNYIVSHRYSTTTDSTLCQQIILQRPIYAQGFRNSVSGHAWVIDGFQTQRKVELYYSLTYPHNLMWMDVTNYGRTYFHCNWGWNGSCNAYVLNFQATANYQYNINNEYLFVNPSLIPPIPELPH